MEPGPNFVFQRQGTMWFARIIVAIALFINLPGQILSIYAKQPLSRRALSQPDNCSETIGVDASNMLQGSNSLDLVGVKGISYSIGYSVTDSFLTAQSLESPNQACSLKMAKIINRAGVARYPNADGAQAAVRSTNFNDPVEQQCPGRHCVLTVSFFSVSFFRLGTHSFQFDRYWTLRECLG